MAKIIFLGTASSIPTKDRDNTSFLFIHKKQTFIVDCPGSIVQKLLRVGIDFKKIQNIIITHEHPDHIYGIVSLIHTQAYLNDRLRIFTNPTCIKIIKKLVEIFELNKKEFPRLDFINVFEKSLFYQNDSLRLAAIKNLHTEDSFGVRFLFGRKCLFYSSDTAFSPAMFKGLGKCNYLIHDTTASSSFFRRYPRLYKMHTDSRTLAKYLRSKPKVKLFPIHFLLLEKGEEERIQKELKTLHGRVIFVKDFDFVSLV